MRNGETHAGGCLCGDVRYRVGGPAVWSAICYCESCTRAAGAPAVAWAGIESARFQVLKGRIRTYESTPGVLRGFCRRCGTTLTYRKDPMVVEGARDDVYVATRTLDDPNAYPPDEHVFYGERADWLDVEDDRPHHDGVSADHAHLQLLTLSRAPDDGPGPATSEREDPVFHMLTCFDLEPGTGLEDFRRALADYTAHMRGLGLLETTGPIGRRQRDTILDTDGERDHEHFFIMTFRDRAQADAAVAYIKGHEEPGDGIHKAVYAKVRNPVFICWQDA